MSRNRVLASTAHRNCLLICA